MFKPTDLQKSLLECEFLLPPEKVARLKKSWAAPFRERVLPLLDEELFREAFSESTGRPNKSIRLLVGLHLLKEWNDLTDEQVLEQLEYNLQWHYALAVEPGPAHVCQKTLHNFRAKLMQNQRAQQLFEQVTRCLAEADGLNLGRQRLDSTHVLSNIAVLTRLGLFVETVTHFLRNLRTEDGDAFESLEAGYSRRYLEREGYFSDAKREQAKRRLPVVAEDVYALVRRFETDAAISSMPSFESLLRLFEEQLEVVQEKQDDDEPGGRLRAKVIEPKEVASDSLQSPHDPDASYGHKGKGYEVQVCESCDEESDEERNKNPYQVITATSVNGAHESDQKALQPMLEQLDESGMLPEELLADTGYGSGANIVESAERGVDLQAPVQDPHSPPAPEHFAASVADELAQEKRAGEPRDAAAEADESEQDSSSEPAPPLGMDAFSFDPSFHQVLCCPAGHEPQRQHVAGGQVIAVFSAAHCGSCPMASQCPTRALKSGERQLRRGSASAATETRQAEQQSASFKDRYRKRSGVESTNQELKGRHGLGNLRIRGKPRIELAVQLKALALNVKRAVQYHVFQMAEMEPCHC